MNALPEPAAPNMPVSKATLLECRKMTRRKDNSNPEKWLRRKTHKDRRIKKEQS